MLYIYVHTPSLFLFVCTGVRRSKLAGNFVTDQLEKLLQDIGVDVVPPVQIAEKVRLQAAG